MYFLVWGDFLNFILLWTQLQCIFCQKHLVQPLYGKCSPYNLIGKASPVRQIIVSVRKSWISYFSSNNGVKVHPEDMCLNSESQSNRDREGERKRGRKKGKGGWIDRWVDGRGWRGLLPGCDDVSLLSIFFMAVCRLGMGMLWIPTQKQALTTRFLCVGMSPLWVQ